MAEATRRVRIGCLVTGNTYRHPGVLAKEAASIDVMSGGRYELALGTGWYQPDYDMLGMVCDPPGRRVARLTEAVRLIKRLWTGDSVDHSGEYYTVSGARVVPPVVQRPHYAKAAAAQSLDPAEVRRSPAYLYGPPHSLHTQILANRERYGLSYYVIPHGVMERFAPVAREIKAHG